MTNAPLLTVPALAQAMLPFMLFMVPILVLGFIPVVAIEASILRKPLGLSARGCIKVSAITNGVSTAAAIPLNVALGMTIPDRFPEWFFFHLPDWEERIILAALLVPFFFACWGIEYLVARGLLKRAQPAPPVRRAVGQANVASFLLLLVLLIAPNPNRLRVAPGAWSPAGDLRTINTAEINYASTYGHGFSPSLAALGPPAGNAPPSAAAADLLFEALIHGERNGYTYTYRPGQRNAKGEIDTYTVSARPLKYEGGETNSYFTDQTGVIRFTNEDRPATSQDPPLTG